jgi:AraC-like DNA-binding protein
MFADVLSDVLRSLRATGTVYYCDQIAPPWEKHFPAGDTASFHQIRRGSCSLQVGDVQEHLEGGDLVFLAPGTEHYLASQAPAADSATAVSESLLLCGYCEFDNTVGTPLNDLFPDLVIIRADQLQSLLWLRAILDQLSQEYLSLRPGTDIVVNRMTEVLIVELIRMNFGRQEQAPLIKALSDKYVAKALQSLHQKPEHPWSLEMLAMDVGQSRAAFAKRFKSLVGQSMFEYLTSIRIQQACQLLAETELPLYEVAGRVGYESDLAFTRTFKKRTGQTPTSYRKQGKAAPSP